MQKIILATFFLCFFNEISWAGKPVTASIKNKDYSSDKDMRWLLKTCQEKLEEECKKMGSSVNTGTLKSEFPEKNKPRIGTKEYAEWPKINCSAVCK